MLESFSHSAHKVIFLSRSEAGRLKFESIELHHLLLGFVLEDQSDSEFQLRKAMGIEEPAPVNAPGIQLKKSFLDRGVAMKLRDTFSAFGSLPESLPPNEDMPVSEAARTALNAAVEHAQGSPVSPLHLLWGMFADEEGSVAHSLIENGVTREQVEGEIRHENRRSSEL